MRKCLIYQPLGLGDIIWVQPIVDKYIDLGYEVHYPVSSIYYDVVCQYIQKENLFFWKETDDFPFKNFYGQHQKIENEDFVYLPLSYANYHIKNASVMMSKYNFSNTPISNWHNNIDFIRNYEREKQLIDTYDLHGDYILVNETFATECFNRNLKINSDMKIHKMNIDEDIKNGFNIFDWIGALEKAKEIHTVETSLCYLIDKYCNNDIYMYEKRLDNDAKNYFNKINLVYRNENWIYES